MASDMEVRMKQRCVIALLHAEKIPPNDIHRRLLNVYGDQIVDVSIVRRWVASFSSGNSDVNDKPRSGQPCERLDQFICANRRITSNELCTELNIGFSALETIMATLEYRKVFARCVPRMLTQENKEHRIRTY